MTALITLTEKKAKAALENMQKTIDEWKALCQEERTEINTLRERVAVKQQHLLRQPTPKMNLNLVG